MILIYKRENKRALNDGKILQGQPVSLDSQAMTCISDFMLIYL